MLTWQRGAIKYHSRCRPERRHISFGLQYADLMSGDLHRIAADLRRVDLAFERGEGAWLTTTDGERYLDFTSGVAVNALGH